MEPSIRPAERLMTRDSKNESGVTLIESLIAILILLVGLLGMAQVLAVSVMASKSYGRDAGKTTVSARDKMEELTALPFTDAGLTAGGSIDSTNPVSGYVDYLDLTGHAVSATSAAYTRQWQIIQDSANVKRVIVSVRSNKSFRYGTAPSTTLVMLMEQPPPPPW